MVGNGTVRTGTRPSAPAAPLPPRRDADGAAAVAAVVVVQRWGGGVSSRGVDRFSYPPPSWMGRGGYHLNTVAAMGYGVSPPKVKRKTALAPPPPHAA